MKKTRRIFTILLAVVMILATMALPALAAEQGLTVDESTANGTISVDKYVVVDRNADIPEETFTFSIGPVTVNAAMQYNGQKVLSGADTIQNGQSTVTFTNTDITTAGSTDSDTAGITTGGANQKYAKKTVAFSLKGVTFTKPGVYCYLIKETAGSTTGMTYSKAQYFAMVFVGYTDSSSNAGPMSILGVNTVKSTNEEGTYIYTNASTKSTAQFINTFDTENLTITKTVTGNMGDRNKDFTFTLKVSASMRLTGASVAAVKTNADGTTSSVSINVDQNYEFTLKHGEKLEVKGLPQGTIYDITETDYSSESYTTTLVTTEDGTPEESTETNTSHNTIVDGGNAEAFTNNKNITTPTGILLDIAPYVLVVLLAGAAAVLMISKKRRATAR